MTKQSTFAQVVFDDEEMDIELKRFWLKESAETLDSGEYAAEAQRLLDKLNAQAAARGKRSKIETRETF